MERTRTRPDNFSLSPSKTSATLAGLMGSGSITSVSSTPLGTVSSMRANMVAQVEVKRSGDLANLCSQSESRGGPRETQRSREHGCVIIAGEDALIRVGRVVGPHNERILRGPGNVFCCSAEQSVPNIIQTMKCNTHTLLSKTEKVVSKCATDKLLFASLNSGTICGNGLCSTPPNEWLQYSISQRQIGSSSQMNTNGKTRQDAPACN